MLIHEHDPEYSNDEAFLCFYQAYFKKYEETLFGGTVAHNIITILMSYAQATRRYQSVLFRRVVGDFILHGALFVFSAFMRY